MSFLRRPKKTGLTKRQGQMADRVAGLPAAEFAAWIEERTEWGADFNLETQLALMRKVWAADRHPAQRWRVTCKRRRERDGLSRLETVVVTALDSFPGRYRLEEALAFEGYGGGTYYISSTRGVKVTARVAIEGEPEDPQFQKPAPEPDFAEKLKRQLEEIALRRLKEDPAAFRTVAIKYLEKELGVKIPLPPEPRPGAPRPYAELTWEEQAWLERNPGAKDEFMARELGIEAVEGEPEEDELLRRLKEKIVSDLVERATARPSEIEAAVSSLIEKTDPSELVHQIVTAWQVLKAGRSVQDAPGNGASEGPGPGSLPE
jgi:hypothetical protein